MMYFKWSHQSLGWTTRSTHVLMSLIWVLLSTAWYQN